MQENDTIRLRHMLDAARQAVEFTRGRTRADLDRNTMLVLALMKLVEIVGEAATQVSDFGRARECFLGPERQEQGKVLHVLGPDGLGIRRT